MRLHRPAIVPQQPNWFRVMRVFLSHEGHVQHECIAETSEAGPATVLASEEPTRAIVTRWDSTTIYDNRKPLDRPEPGRA